MFSSTIVLQLLLLLLLFDRCVVYGSMCVYARVYMWRPLNPSAFVTPKTVIEHPQPEPIKSTTRSLRDVNLFNLYNRAGNSCEVRLLDMSFISCLSGYLADAVGNFGYPTINRSKILGLFCGFSEGS